MGSGQVMVPPPLSHPVFFRTSQPLSVCYVVFGQAIVEFHSSEAAEAGPSSRPSRVGQLEMPEDGSTTAVSGKGLSCTVRGLKVNG